MPSITGHPSRERLFAFSQGYSSTEELALIDEHLRSCVQCLISLDATPDGDTFIDRLRAVSRAPAGRNPAPPAPTNPPAGGYPAIPGFEIVGELGRGGAGVVFEARQHSLNRPVALKMLHPGPGSDAEHLARFRGEAEKIASLNHPNIIRIFDIGTHDGLPYLALELAEGGSLAARLQSTPQPPHEAAALVETLARAVHEAHRSGIVHRDLKPANILLRGTPGGRLAEFELKVSDFGLARRVDQDQALTGTGLVAGTPSYMSPEQAGGRKEVGPATDVYALGAILYEMLTGRVPYCGLTPLDTLDQIRSTEPVPPARLQPGVPRDLETVCLTCLRKEPERRYASALALADDLHAFLRDRPIQARHPTALERVRRAARKHPALTVCLVGIVFLVLLGVAGTAVAFVSVDQARDLAIQAASSEADAFEVARAAGEKQKDLASRLATQLYAARSSLIQHAWSSGDLLRANQLLALTGPQGGSPDLRGWEWHYLDRLCHQERMRLAGHDGPVFAVAYSPDGRWLASAGGGNLYFGNRAGGIRAGQLFLRDAATGRVRHRLGGHAHLITAVDFSPDGRRLASVGLDGEVVVWDTATGREIARLKGHAPGLASVSFDPTGRRVLSAAGGGMHGTGWGDQTIRLWDVETAKEVRRYGDGSEEINSAAFGPAGDAVAYATPKRVRCLDAETGVERWHANFAAGIDRVAFSPDGALLAAGGWDGRVRVLDAKTGRPRLHLTSQVGKVRDVAFSADGKFLAAGGDTPEVRVWRADNGALVRVVRGPTNIIESIAFSPDGKRLASGDHEGLVKVWELQADQRGLLLDHGEYPARTDLRFAPGGGPLLVVASALKRVDSLDGRTGQTRRMPVPGMLRTGMAVLSPDGTRLAHLVSHPEPHRLAVSELPGGKILFPVDDDPRPVCGMNYSPDGGLLLVSRLHRHGIEIGKGGGEYSFVVEVRDSRSGRRLLTLDAGRRRACDQLPRLEHGASLSMSHDGRWLAHAGHLGKLHVWEWKTGRLVAELGLEEDWHRHPTFGKDGRLLAAHVADKDVAIWRTDGWREHTRIPYKSGEAGIAFSPDGRRLATTNQRGVVNLYDPDAGALLFELPGLASPFGTTGIRAMVAFDETGQRLASFNNNATTNLFDASPVAAVEADGTPAPPHP